MQTLSQFYKEIQAWIEAGTPPHPKFRKHWGLCLNLENWSSLNLDRELTSQFFAAGLNTTLPFNRNFDNPEGTTYDWEVVKKAIYKNPKRLAWILQHSKD